MTGSKVATLSNNLERDPEEMADIVEAIEDAGYVVEGPESNDSLGIDGSDFNDYYWSIQEEADR